MKTSRRLAATAFLALAALVFPAHGPRADEIDAALAMFSENNGLSAAEKLPALDTVIGLFKDNPKVSELVSLRNSLALETGPNTIAAAEPETETGMQPGTGIAQAEETAAIPEVAETEVAQAREATALPEEAETGVAQTLESATAPEETETDATQMQEPAATPEEAETSAQPEAEETRPRTLEDEEADMLELFRLGPPTEEEIQEAFAALPPLTPIAMPSIRPAPNAIPEELLDAATSRSAAWNVMEQMRLFIGEMSEEDAKAFDEKWQAVLDYPCKETTDWLKQASPIVSEMLGLQAELGALYDAFEQALAEGNNLRMFRLWTASHEAMREALTASMQIKAVLDRMEELENAMEALGQMPDPVEIGAERTARRKAAEEAVQEYFGAELESGIGGWYEPVGLTLAGRPAVLDKKGNMVGEEPNWWCQEPGEPFYIRPLFKYPDTGVVVIYINQYDGSIPDMNLVKGLECEDGSFMVIDRYSRTMYSLYRDEEGTEFLSVKRSDFNGRNGPDGICVYSTLYKYIGGADLTYLPGSEGNDVVALSPFDRKNPAKDDVAFAEAWGRLYADEVKDAVEVFQEKLDNAIGKDNLPADMPYAKDIYYVLSGMEHVTGKRKELESGSGTFPVYPTDSHYEDTIEKLEGVTSRSFKGNRDLAVQKGMFRCDIKRVDKVYDERGDGRLTPLDTGTAESHIYWMPPPPVLRGLDSRYTISFWPSVEISPPGHAKMHMGWLVRCGTTWQGEEFSEEFREIDRGEKQAAGTLVHPFVHALEFYPEIGLDFILTMRSGVDGFGDYASLSVRYNYKRMVLTPEEAERIAGEVSRKCKEELMAELDSVQFALAARQIDDFAARLRAQDEETVSRADRAEFHRENIRWSEECAERLRKQMAEERENYEAAVREIREAREQVRRKRDEGIMARFEERKKEVNEQFWYDVATFHYADAAERDRWAYRDLELFQDALHTELSVLAKRAEKTETEQTQVAKAAAERYSQLKFALVAQKSNASHEQDLLYGVETGISIHTQTAFEEMCHKQLLEGAQREVERDRKAKELRLKVRKAIQNLARQDEAKDRGTFLRLAKYHDEKAALDLYEKAVGLYTNMPPPTEDSMEIWLEFGRTVQGINLGHAGQEQGKAMEELLDTEENLRRAQWAKFGSTVLLCLGTMGASTPEAAVAMHEILVTHYVANGFIEDGVVGALKGYVRVQSLFADFLIGSLEGYRDDGYRGMVLNAGIALAFHVGMPLVSKIDYLKMPLSKILPTAKERMGGNLAKLKSLIRPQELDAARKQAVQEYRKFMKEGEKLVCDFFTKVKKVQLDKSFMTPEELDLLNREIRASAVRINEHPGAKAILKYGGERFKTVSKRFVTEINGIYSDTEQEFYRLMAEAGFDHHGIKQFRNPQSEGTVGMDGDFGIADESVPIYRYGEKCSLHDWLEAGKPLLAQAYSTATGGGNLKKAWGQLTTSKVAEGYANPKVLKLESSDNMRDLLDNMSLSEAQQLMDVTYWKAWDMLEKQNEFPKLFLLREICRGTAKDMNGKFLKALETRIMDLNALKARKGPEFTAAEQRELTRLNDSYEHFTKVYEGLNMIGEGKADPLQFNDIIRDCNGPDKDIFDTINDMRTMMQSLVFRKTP